MPKKYLDFAESAPHVRLAKQNARDERDTRSYITITCPHCSVDFVEIAVGQRDTDSRNSVGPNPSLLCTNEFLCGMGCACAASLFGHAQSHSYTYIG